MAAIQVTSAGTNSLGTYSTARNLIRNSSGIPYVVVYDSSGQIEVWKGNSATPSSFSEQDSANKPSNSDYTGGSAAIDSTGVIHIAYYDSSSTSSKAYQLRYVTFNTSTNTFSGDTSVYTGSLMLFASFSIAIDSNDIPHIVFIDRMSNMGTNYDTLLYTNRIGGSWKTPVEIEGKTTSVSCFYPDITFNGSNIPWVSYSKLSANETKTAEGNANDATSFTLRVVNDVIANSSQESCIVFDSSGNGYVFWGRNSDNHIIVDSVTGGTDTDTGAVGTANNKFRVSVDGTSLYIFYEDASNDIAYYYNTGSGWTSGGVLETGTYNFPKSKWARYVEYDSSGTNRAGGSGRLEIDYVFVDETASTDVWWNTLTLATPGVGGIGGYGMSMMGCGPL